MKYTYICHLEGCKAGGSVSHHKIASSNIIFRNFDITKLRQAKLEFDLELDAPLLQVRP